MTKTKQVTNDGVFLSPESELTANQRPLGLWVLALYLVLISIGLMNLYSASGDAPYFQQQLVKVVLSIGLFATGAYLIPIRFLNFYAKWIYGIACISLIAVLVLGYTAGGSQRWLHFGSFNFQPSEFAKLAVVILVAHYFAHEKRLKEYYLTDLAPLAVYIGIIFALIFKQPDLGTAGICLLIALAQIAFVRLNLKSMGLALLGAIIIVGLSWNFVLHDYQKMRILTLINPRLDPHGSGYNSIQSLVAIGSGQLTGKGLLQGTQTQLQFLPARHTDFIFAVFAEEWGFIGSMVVFILYCCLTFIALEISKRAVSLFSALLAIGLIAIIFIEFAINIAMVLGMFPVVGMPLPFFSYGGSALLTMSFALGLLVGIHRESQQMRRQTYHGHQTISLTPTKSAKISV